MKLNALVIDDEQIVLDSVRKILATKDYKVDTTLNGVRGIEMAIENHYDVVLTDIRMPEVNGLIVLRDIKRSKPSLPVIIITGYGSIKSAVQAMKLGASDYIEKPFEPDEILNTIKTAIEEAKIREPEDQSIIHREEVIRALEKAATDDHFRHQLIQNGSDALDEFRLTGPEKLALITGDIKWIEAEIGPLKPNQKKWLEDRLSAEIW